MILYFLIKRLKRIGRRPVADPSIKASIREGLVQAGCLPSSGFFGARVRVAFASLGVLITGLGGTVSYAYASDAVLPDTPLYPVRQKVEAIEIRLAPTREVRAKVIEKQVARRKKEAHLLETLKKPLPAVHAKILKEEREERRVEASSSTRIRLLQPLRAVPLIKAREKDKDGDRQEQKREPLLMKGIFKLPQEEREEPMREGKATTTRSLLPLKEGSESAKEGPPSRQRERRERRRFLDRLRGERERIVP